MFAMLYTAGRFALSTIFSGREGEKSGQHFCRVEEVAVVG